MVTSSTRPRKILDLINLTGNSNSSLVHLQAENNDTIECVKMDNAEEIVTSTASGSVNDIITPMNTQICTTLVPYSESSSDNEDKPVAGCVPNVSSSSSSSSTSSSSSSSTSSASSTSSDDVIEKTPPKRIDNVSKINHSRCIRKNYQISPIYTDESEIDLSDSDPTFVVSSNSQRKRNYFINQSTSSSNSIDSDTAKSSIKKGRKCVKNPTLWKQNKIKMKRNKGKSYVSLSKSCKNIPARCLKEPCTQKCRLKCAENMDIDNRYELFHNFWNLGNLIKQREYINSCMTDIAPRYKYTNSETRRRNNKAFYFLINNNKIRVCKTFFKATLDISNRMIFTVQSKATEYGCTLEDFRGRHQNHRKIDPEVRTAIKEHINSIPRIESHCLRASTTREYIEDCKTVKDLYNDFKLQQHEQNQEAASYTTYYKIFRTEFNIGFFRPNKDQCDLCISYYNSNSEEKNNLEVKYQTHIVERNHSRIEKMNDRKKVNKNMKVVVYDLEAVLTCPRGDVSSFYYKSKLNCYNLTLTELTQYNCKVAYENVHCYFWSECDAKRGAVEIGSCIWEYLKSISEQDDDAKEIIFYSDNCCGQNKNKYIASLYLYAVQNLNIRSITHKFLVQGHTQNEADSVHRLIDKEIRRNLKSGPIYTPDQYITLIKNAKKSKPPVMVHEMNFQSFYDLKLLQNEWGYNFTTNTCSESVNWNNIKVLRMTKENTTKFLYKTSYKEEGYKEIDVRNKRKKMMSLTEIVLKTAYSAKQELSENKKNDLKDLISKSLIPDYYASFYNSII